MALKMVIMDDFTKDSLMETKSLLEALAHQIPQYVGSFEIQLNLSKTATLKKIEN